jgi:hypothetical protein
MKDFGINSLDDLKSDEEKKKFFKAVDKSHVAKNEIKEEDAYDNERFIIIDGKAKKDDGNTPDKKDHVYAPDAKTALQLHKQGKKVYRESVDPSCPICEGEACQCAQAPSDTESVSEMKMNAMKMPINSMMVKTAQDDAKPMADLSTSYSKDDVRASVKDGGGKDMAKVNDTPEMMAAMKKINATYRKEKYLPVKEGSIEDAILNMKMLEEQTVNIKGKELDDMIKQYLAKGGTVTKLPPALAKGMKPSGQATFKVGDKGIIKSMYKMKEVREFVSTYNLHFLSNYKAEELMVEARYEVSHDYGSRFGSYGVILTAVVDATSPQDAMKKGHDKLETLSMSAQGKKLGVDELQDPDDEGKPTVKQTSKPITYTDMKKV